MPDGSQGIEKSASSVLPALHLINIFSCLLVAGFQPKSFFKLPQRLIKLAWSGLHHTQIHMRQSIVRFKPDDLRILQLGVGDLLSATNSSPSVKCASHKSDCSWSA